MELKTIEYKIKTALLSDVYAHLVKCKNNFIPALDKKVDLLEYSKKIIENAVTFEAWSSFELVGVIAAYFNDIQNQKGYITNVSTLKEYFGLRIGTNLLKNCIDYAKSNNFKEIELEVNAKSLNAIKLYNKFDFIEFDSNGEFVKMKVLLK